MQKRIKCAFLLIATIMVCATIKPTHQATDTFDDDIMRSHTAAHKDWTIVIYMAADNDLRGFAARNIKQMAAIGSNEFCNIVVHLDIKISGNKKITRRYYIEKNKILHVNGDDPETQKMDSGDPNTLISCCSWAITHYPAQHYALIFWNHGTGYLDPANGRIINPTEKFTFNPTSNKFELDRTIPFLDFVNTTTALDRGICWDDSNGSYLTNQKLQYALETVCNNHLDGRKLDIIGFDACLMSMLEIANLIKPYCRYMIGSQEVELGTGWNYQRALSPFLESSIAADQLAQHIVKMYGITYSTITDDYTQSAIALDTIDDLETAVNTLAELLIFCLDTQKGNSVYHAIHASRSPELCTHFDEPSYVDLHHLVTNLQANISYFKLLDSSRNYYKIEQLQNILEDIKNLIYRHVIANTTGKNLRLAGGISIYFPERKIHYSYKKTPFALNGKWFDFLKRYFPV